MKKWFNIAVLAVLVGLMACTKVENTPEVQESISYAVGSYAQATKTPQELGTGDYAGITSFKSSAWLHANGSATGTAFFANETISKTGSTWEPAQDYYWPKHPSSYLNFVSWYSTITPDSGYPTEDAINWTVSSLADDDDIMIAQKAWRQKSNVQTYYTPGVPTLFRHVLAQVGVNAKSSIATETSADGVTTTWTVKISNFKIKDVYAAGTLSLTNTTEPTDYTVSSTTTWTGDWSYTGSKTDIDGPATETELNADDYTAIVAMRSVLPQSVSGASMSMDVEITTQSAKNGNSISLTEKVTMDNIALSDFTGYNGDWDMNKKITYNIIVNPKTGAITLIPVLLNDWATANSILIIE